MFFRKRVATPVFGFSQEDPIDRYSRISSRLSKHIMTLFSGSNPPVPLSKVDGVALISRAKAVTKARLDDPIYLDDHERLSARMGHLEQFLTRVNSEEISLLGFVGYEDFCLGQKTAEGQMSPTAIQANTGISQVHAAVYKIFDHHYLSRLIPYVAYAAEDGAKPATDNL